MRAVDLIRKKRDGQTLSPTEIDWSIQGLLSGEIADYQWSALLMAILWRGMNDEETASLTDAMTRSGTIVDLSSVPGLKIDKHSTGGVGDKTSLILAPIAAAVGVPVPMVSGRGLGHTGGTLDKLESIPGFQVRLGLDAYLRVLRECGLVMIGQTAEIAPADMRLYALRDATATVESIPLISASIMSKKLAEGIDGLVLDVKTGGGAFMRSLDDARRLANSMVSIGRGLGKRMVALVTRMDQPLGRAVGNAIEVAEAVECLRGEGPSDLTDLSIELAAEMVVLGERAATLEEARRFCRNAIDDGSALDVFRRLVSAQGGDPRAIDDFRLLPTGETMPGPSAERAGFVTAVDARRIGTAAMILGAGRSRVDSVIDPAVGVVLRKKVGDPVVAGEPFCDIVARDGFGVDPAFALLQNAFLIADRPVETLALIVERLKSV